MVIAPLSNTVIRESVMDFCEPFYQEYNTVLIRMQGPYSAKWNLYIDPFKGSVWLCISLSVPIAGVMIWLVTIASPYYGTKGVKNGLQQLEYTMMYSLGSMFSQGMYTDSNK